MVAQGLATSESRQVAREIQQQLQARDIQGLAFLAFAGASGVLIAQEVTERVLPLLGMNRDPSTTTGFLAAGAVKVAYALVVGAVAANMSGVLLVALAFHAAGSVVFAGADFFNALQRSGFLSESTSFNLGGQQRRRRVPARKTGGNGGGNRSTATQNGGGGGGNAHEVSV